MQTKFNQVLLESRFFHEIRVRWSEIDAQQVVFNGHYLNFFDIALNEFFRHQGIQNANMVSEHGCDFFAKKATIEYHLPAHFDELLRVYVSVQRIGNSSIVFEFDIRRDEAQIVSGEIVYVCFDVQNRRPLTIPDQLKAQFLA